MGICPNPENDMFQDALNGEIYVDKSSLIAHTNAAQHIRWGGRRQSMRRMLNYRIISTFRRNNKMHITKKIVSVMLAAVVLFQAGAMTVFGENAKDEKQIITISNIDISQLTGKTAESSTEIRTEGIPRSGIEIISEEWTDINEYVISGRNISIRDGKYNYRLVIRSDRTLTFDNDLEINYQGINGKYKLHYDIDETDNHTMIVTGTFDNIIISSPLMQKLSASDREWILSHISRDSYFYQLILKTKEGFSFMNTLRFLFDARQCGYSVRYGYDLLKNNQTLMISGIPDGDETAGITNDTSKAVDTQPESIRIVEIRYGKLKRKAQTIKASELFSPAVRGQGKAIYGKVSGN